MNPLSEDGPLVGLRVLRVDLDTGQPQVTESIRITRRGPLYQAGESARVPDRFIETFRDVDTARLSWISDIDDAFAIGTTSHAEDIEPGRVPTFQLMEDDTLLPGLWVENTSDSEASILGVIIPYRGERTTATTTFLAQAVFMDLSHTMFQPGDRRRVKSSNSVRVVDTEKEDEDDTRSGSAQ